MDNGSAVSFWLSALWKSNSRAQATAYGQSACGDTESHK